MAAPPTANEPAEPQIAYSTDCPCCGGAGFYKRAVMFGDPDFGRLFPCDCKLRERSARQVAAAERQRAELLDRLAGELGRLARCRFDNFDLDRPLDPRFVVPVVEQAESLRRAAAAMRAYADAPRGWRYLTGPPGAGKSHLAAATGHALVERGMEVYYRSAPDMLDALRAGYRAGDYDDRLDALKNVAVLILDDLGAEPQTESNAAILFQLLNDRGELAGRSTIITSNSRIEDLPFRLASRIRGAAGAPVELLASDYRAIGGRS